MALALGDHAAAEKAYREALEREPGSGRAYFGLAAALDGLGKADRGARRAQPRREGVGQRRRDLPQVQALKTSTAAPQQ